MANDLFSPYSFSDFLENYFEKEPLHLSRTEDHNNNILSEKEINAFFQRNDILHPLVRLFKDGSEIDWKEYTNSTISGNKSIDGYVDNNHIFSYFNSGATIVIYTGQRFFPNLRNLCLELNAKLRCPIQANVYITPPQSRGLTAHYDTHDVIVLQTLGCKTWQLFGSEIELPTQRQKSQKITKTAVTKTVDISSGDLLYLPRGVVHSAETSSAMSIHVTIGIYGYTWESMFMEMLNRIDQNILFRKSVPLWNPSKLDEEFKLRTEALQSSFTSEQVQRVIRSFIIGSNTSRINSSEIQFSSMILASKLKQESVLKMANNTNISVSYNEETLTLEYSTKSITFPIFVSEAIRFILQAKEFSVSELPELDNESKMILVSKLITEGFLLFVEA